MGGNLFSSLFLVLLFLFLLLTLEILFPLVTGMFQILCPAATLLSQHQQNTWICLLTGIIKSAVSAGVTVPALYAGHRVKQKLQGSFQ